MGKNAHLYIYIIEINKQKRVKIMSNPKKAINEIKSLLVEFGFMAAEKTPLSFKLQDDTIINVAELKAGEKITKINEAFEAVTLEDGVYRLKENFEVEVSGGQITNVKEIFIEAKLKDGTIVKVEGDSLMEGAAVKVVTEEMPDGTPAPDGIHILEDETKVETKDGKIVAIAAPEMKEEEKSEESSMEDSDGGAAIEIELIEMLKDFMKKMNEKMSLMEDKMSAVQNDFAAFKSEPAAKKISDGKTEFKSEVNDMLDDKVAAIFALKNNNKK